jgi:hypothetical protein
LAVFTLVGLGITLGSVTPAQHPIPQRRGWTSQPARGAIPPKKLKGRLPRHYGKVVTEQQRQKIYEIQTAYEPYLERLELQLDKLTRQRDARIEAVLTPAQLQQIAKWEAAAKAKREKKKKKQSKPGLVGEQRPRIAR